MSNIAVALDQLIKESNPPITGADIARAAGIEMAQISRIRNGKQIWVNPQFLHKVAKALCKDTKSKRFAAIHARLLYGHLMDECSGDGARLITITLHDHKPEQPGTAFQDKPVLPPSIQADLDAITKHVLTDQNVRDLVIAVAKLCRRNAASQPNPK